MIRNCANVPKSGLYASNEAVAQDTVSTYDRFIAFLLFLHSKKETEVIGTR